MLKEVTHPPSFETEDLTEDMMHPKANEPIQTCLDMAREGKMPPLPGVNCIHTAIKDKTIPKTPTTFTITETSEAPFDPKILEEYDDIDVKVPQDTNAGNERVDLEVYDLEDDFPVLGKDINLATKIV